MNKGLSHIKVHKLITLIICLILTSAFIYSSPSSTVANKDLSLQQALKDIEGWDRVGNSPLEPEIVKALELDDYINQNYSNGTDTISLYIGYYLTTKKVGAAHDPLVCFPGQGWVLSNREKNEIKLNPGGSELISYSKMTAERGLQKELIVYWFQSYDRANPDTFTQKIGSLYHKICNHREDNAFVRISTPIQDKSLSECREIILGFINTFYPAFLTYVKQG
jgi:EpsI family protein